MKNKFYELISSMEDDFDIEKLIDECDIKVSNFEEFLDCLIYYVNEMRVNLSPEEFEEYYPYQKLVSNDFYRILYNRLKEELNMEELPDDVNEKLKRKYKEFNSISNITRTTSIKK